jgi:hypothetical protein
MVRHKKEKPYIGQGAIQPDDSFDKRNYAVNISQKRMQNNLAEDDNLNKFSYTISKKNINFKSRKKEMFFEIQTIKEEIKKINRETSIPTEKSTRKIEKLNEKRVILEEEYRKILQEEFEQIENNQTEVTLEFKEPLKAEQQDIKINFYEKVKKY